MQANSFEGRHFLALGASDGIGYAVASRLLRSKAIVTICGRSPEKLEAARKRAIAETGASHDRLRTMALDAADPAAVDAAAHLAADEAGDMAGIFVTAGGAEYANVLDNRPDTVASQWAANVFPVVNAINAGAARMGRAGGSIVAVSSVAAVQSLPGMSSYGAAKAGLEQYVRTAADELGKLKIRVNAVRPGLTKTGVTGPEIDDPKYIERFTRHTPLGYYGIPDDFAPMVSLLLSSDTSWITGQIFSIDGGLSLRGYGGEIIS